MVIVGVKWLELQNNKPEFYIQMISIEESACQMLIPHGKQIP